MPPARHRSRRSESSTSSVSSLSRYGHASQLKNVKIKNGHRQRDRRKKIDLLKVQNARVATNSNSNSGHHRSKTVDQKKSKSKRKEEKVVKNYPTSKARRAAAAAAAEVIDLCTPVNAIAPVIVTTDNLAQLSLTTTTTITTDDTSTEHRTFYESRTLTSNNIGRRSILPAFPTMSENNHHSDLLLANVPDHLLSAEEQKRRRSQRYRPPFHVIGTPSTNVLANTKIPSFFWPIYQELFGNISEHLHIDIAIVDYNYARLSKCVDLWAKERILRFKKAEHEVTLDQREYAIALEFYLQIDVDLFYMKTCSFRNAQPLESQKYLFCSTDPVARYEMIACGNCGLCYPKYNVQTRRQPVVDFGLATRRHRFVNKYETILNCPCSCNTSNIIYVLTCPCGNFDYIGETGASLADRIQAHRFHGNRIMHETFLGQANIKLAHPDYVKSAEILSKDDMQLYRHSTECPSAIQMFLDENSRYWRFVPMSNEEANQPEQNILHSTMDIKLTDVQDHNTIKLFIQNVPAPPSNFRFTARQYHLQYVFFKSRRHLEMPNTHLDLYNAKIIAVLPETGSTVLRQVVESLLITHTESKLNSSGRLFDYINSSHSHNNNNNNNNNIQNDDGHENNIDNVLNRRQDVVWCQGLVRRPISSVVTTTTTAAAAVVTSK